MAARAASVDECLMDPGKGSNSCSSYEQLNEIVTDFLERRCASPGGSDSLGCRDGELEEVVEGYVKRYEEVRNARVVHLSRKANVKQASSCNTPACPGFFGP